MGVKACTVMIDQSTDTTCPAIALIGAHGDQRIIESRRQWTDADLALALQAASRTYGVPIAVDRPVAPQPVQSFGQTPPKRPRSKGGPASAPDEPTE